jgi:putative oxidoreductase
LIVPCTPDENMRDYIAAFEFGKTHNDVALELIRVLLGIALFVRGVLFISDSSVIMEIIAVNEVDYFLPSFMFFVAILAHLAGGLLMMIGLLTRIAALIQIPVLVGAVVIAILQGGLFLPTQSLELSVLVLGLLIVFLISGSGRYSVHHLVLSPGRAEATERKNKEDSLRRAEQARLQDAVGTAQVSEGHNTLVGSPTLSASEFHDQNISRLIRAAQYITVLCTAIVLLFFGLKSIPFEISAAELAAVAGILVMVLTVFFLFFGWALREFEEPKE